MEKKWLIVVASLVCFACIMLIVLSRERPRVTEEQYDAIQVGMTLVEVEEILGCAPGDYSLSGRLLPLNMQFQGEERQGRADAYKEWAGDYPDPPHENANGPNRQDAVAIRVWFDEEGKVIDKCRMGHEYTIPSLTTRIERSWLRFRSVVGAI
jgi:hypothetical protein